MISRALCLGCLFFIASPSIAATQDAKGIGGLWVGSLPAAGRVEFDSFRIQLEVDQPEVGKVRARLTLAGRILPFAGSFDRARKRLKLSGKVGSAVTVVNLRLDGSGFVGVVEQGGARIPVRAHRPTPAELAPLPPIVVDLSVKRPRTITLKGLDAARAKSVVEAIETAMRKQSIVGLSAAIVRDGRLHDLRSFGWEDARAEIAASDETMYRWASISKPLTSVAAMQLVEKGKLDLDRDVRKYVSEFPKKAWPVTSRQLMCHQGGITHYRDMKIRTIREYEVEHPWADRILALDMFKETDLLFEPGTEFSYSTPGYSLLGAVIERAGGAQFALQVKKRVLDPLKMASMQPDYPWVDIPHRSQGYQRGRNGQVIQSADDNINWKLPAGGYISTVGDLARLANAFITDEVMSAESRKAMTTVQATSRGKRNAMGLGIRVGEVDGKRFLAHSGGQNKTSTFLLIVPEDGAAVALMCNTQGASLRALARRLMRIVLKN